MTARQGANVETVALAMLSTYVCAVIAVQLVFVLDLTYFHEEHRLLFIHHQLSDPQLFAGDYITSFIGAFRQPFLYEGLTHAWLSLGGDLIVLHRLVPVVCWLAFLIAIAVAARRLGDNLTAVAAVALAVAQPLYMYQITSALPHAFGFPLLGWSVVALLRHSVAGLAATTLLSGLLYPAVAPLVGLLLAWQVLAASSFRDLPGRARLNALALLCALGSVTLWLVLATLEGPQGFGAPLAPLADSERFPENGPDGRHFYAVFHPLMYVFGRFAGQFHTLGGFSALCMLVAYLLVAAYGLAVLPRQCAARRPLVAYIVLAALVWVAIYLLKPYLSYRFVLYPAFTLLPLLAAIGLRQACQRLPLLTGRSGAATVVLVGAAVATLDSFDPEKLGYGFRLDESDQRVLSFAAAQPEGTLVAIWPQSGSALELLPYGARRPLFLMQKAHYPTYQGHLLAMRARAEALIDSYLAVEPLALRRLHCEWQVDYLVVDAMHFSAAGERPSYFAPFDSRIATVWAANEREGFLLQQPDLGAVVLEAGTYRVVDLAAVVGAAGCPPSGRMAEAD